MMTYPNSYALLSEEELEYTTGGALDAETVGNWISTAMNVTMGVLAIVNVVNAIKKGQISSVLASVLGTGAGLLAYVNIANIGSVAAQVQKQYPEQYPEEGHHQRQPHDRLRQDLLQLAGRCTARRRQRGRSSRRSVFLLRLSA